VLTWLAESWVSVNNSFIAMFLGGSWEVSGIEAPEPGRSYLVSSNHQSWTDIVVLQRVFCRRIPFLRFFIKQELIWVPILGVAWWGLDFPFMKRYSREFLKQHPEKRGADMEATRRSCERLRDVDLSLTNFLEGTRFTPAKHRAQKSPYRHLLSPRAGGVAFVLGALGEKLTQMVDATIIYPDGAPKMWDFLCGRVQRIIVDVRVRDVPPELRRGDYAQDERYRTAVQTWVREIWTAKDQLIDSVEAEVSNQGPARAPRATGDVRGR
jgi:1-acyl-sn-glycerol-3-phosphate acyltransferase